MKEQEPGKEIINKGDLYFLMNPETVGGYSGYGLTTLPNQKDFLVGFLKVDLEHLADPQWHKTMEERYGEYQVGTMPESDNQGVFCQIQIDGDSLPYVQKMSFNNTPTPIEEIALDRATETKALLDPFLDTPPKPSFDLAWIPEKNRWLSMHSNQNELPPALRETFEQTGYGCLAIESNWGVAHICHAPDADIAGFSDKPVMYQWQLVKMPTAPLIRLEMKIMDLPLTPYMFESFLNIASEEQAGILGQLANQDRLYLAFYGDDLSYHSIKTVDHDEQQWQKLDEIVNAAHEHLQQISAENQDFNKAKADFMQQYI